MECNPFTDGEQYSPREGPNSGNLPGGRLYLIASTHTYASAHRDHKSMRSLAAESSGNCMLCHHP